MLVATLAGLGLEFVLVGSAALRAMGRNYHVHDVDVVVRPSETNLHLLHAVLSDISLDKSRVPRLGEFRSRDIVRIETAFAPLDCMLRTGRSCWETLRSRSCVLRMWDTNVRVGGIGDVLALRRCFKAGSTDE